MALAIKSRVNKTHFSIGVRFIINYSDAINRGIITKSGVVL
jgi:hypothetical protein